MTDIFLNLSDLHTKVDLLAKGLKATAEGWSERFGLIEREITQQHRWQQDHEEQAERGRRRRAVDTRVWLGLIALAATLANGALQIVSSTSRASLRAEVITELKVDNAEIIKKAAEAAVQASDRRFELQIKGAK
jgi:hypothetical protein